MRRLMILLLAWLAPVWAQAAPDTPYAPETIPRYALLTEAQQSLLDVFYAAAAEGETRVDLPDGTRYDDAAAALELLILDFPELAGLKNEYALGYMQHDPAHATYAELRYDASGEALRSLRSALLTEAASLAAAAQGDAFTRSLTLHDALCARAAYDLSADHAHNAYGALAEGRATCEGYAQAMTLLCRLAGIPCGMVTGLAWDGTYMSPHAWNYMCLGGRWCQTDATWDDQQTTLHWYFGLSAAQMGADHQWEYLPPFAAAGEGCEYHQRMGMEAASLAEAEEILRKGIAAGSASIRFVREEDYAAFAGDVGGALERVNQRAEEPFYGAYQVMTSPQQRCVTVVFGQ